MSEKLVTQPRLPEGRSISRRTALRGAAWTAPAITIAVATPNFAATSHDHGEMAAAWGTPVRNTSDKTVTWTFVLTNSGTVPLHNLAVTFGAITDVTGLVVTSGSSPDVTTWSGSNGLTRTFGTLGVGKELNVTAVFTRSSNGVKEAGQVSCNVTAGPPSVILVGTTGNFS